MRYALTLALCLYALPSFAGGIGFGPKYVGKHPFTGGAITLVVPQDRDKKITLTVGETLGHADDLTLTLVSRNRFETIFNLTSGDENGAVVAKVVTTGDCQIVQTAALVFPSGVSTTLYAADRRANIKPNQP